MGAFAGVVAVTACIVEYQQVSRAAQTRLTTDWELHNKNKRNPKPANGARTR